MECWLMIFSHLDYFGLKRCTMVNKDFKAISEHSSFDKVSFRGPAPLPPGTTIVAKDVDIHPVLQEMSYECSPDIKHAFLFSYSDRKSSYSDDGLYLIVNSSAYKEHATQPPLQVIVVKVHGKKCGRVKNDSGVTVKDVLGSLASFFRRDYNRECMGDHTGWTGFDRQTLDKEGNLVLTAESFDS